MNKSNKVFTGGPGAGGAHGAGARRASTSRSGRRSSRSRAKIGCTAADAATLGATQHERDAGVREGVTTSRGAARQGARAREPRTAPGQRDPEGGERVFRPGGARPPTQVMRAFIDEHRDRSGSSRSARCCRSPRPGIDGTRHGSAARIGAAPRATRRGAGAADRARLAGQHAGLRRRQGLAAAAVARARRWPAARSSG